MKTTELVFILDKSGSMCGMEDDVIGGFNSMIEKQKKEEGKAYVSTVAFSNYSEVIYDRVCLESVAPLTRNDYCVDGCTALYDAIGDAIKHIRMVHKYVRPEDKPEQTIFIITTDGMENASHRYTKKSVKNMIEEQEKVGWEFVFVGANIDAVETATGIGIRSNRAVNYSVEEDTDIMFKEMSATIATFRSKGKLDEDWAQNVQGNLLSGDKKVKK
ncbi:MAG: VWA domain-containing protein [Clostridia bacterium]|nr:VWA domain-containing protein [Clostridia bacterium]